MSYECQAKIEINQPPETLFSWILTPQQIKLWVIHVDETTWMSEGDPQIGSRFEMSSYIAGQFTSYTGEITHLSYYTQIEKKYSISGSKAGGWLPVPMSEGEYKRLVSYMLTPTRGGTLLACQTITTIPGIKPSIAKITQKVEQKHLVCSLDRLSQTVPQGKLSFLGKMYTSTFIDPNCTFAPL